MEHVCSEKGEKLDTRKEDAFPEVQKKEKRRGKGCTCKQKGIKPATLRLVLAGRRAPPKLAVAMPRGEKKIRRPRTFSRGGCQNAPKQAAARAADAHIHISADARCQ